MAKSKTIDDVGLVEDAVILGHLRAAVVNIDYAVKDFKRHHFDLFDTELRSNLEFLRSWANKQLKDYCDYCNAKVNGMREAQMRKQMKFLKVHCPGTDKKLRNRPKTLQEKMSCQAM